MTWSNDPLVLYHGCDDTSAASITTPAGNRPHGINVSHSRPLTDFGRGFYTTTSLHQAKNWANIRCKRLNGAPGQANALATILQFNVDRDALSKKELLTFVIEGQDFWDFVSYCRLGSGPHRPVSAGRPAATNYDIIFGPVSVWPQTLILSSCDQVSFHTPAALAILPAPTRIAQGSQAYPYFP